MWHNRPGVRCRKQQATEIDSAASGILDLDPDPATWSAIQLHSTGSRPRSPLPVIAMTRSFPLPRTLHSQRRGSGGAPIFYRDVPLMPTVGTNESFSRFHFSHPSHQVASSRYSPD